jgi:hypothetical protein
MKMPFRYGCVVEGEYFCPRPELERQLRDYAEAGQNLVIQGERRMGKTSLVKKAISGMKGERLLYIDFYGIRTLSDFCRRVMSGVGGVTEKMPFLKKALALAHRLRPALTIDATTGAPTITVDAKAASDPDSLDAVMTTIKKLAEDGGLCVVMDEFQDLLKLEDADRILAEMRGTIQFQGDTPYFYLGSVRNDMLKIFTHPDSPFFKSALAFEVPPIDTDEFARFIVARFRKGECGISMETARTAIEFAGGVSGDVQELCDALWGVTEEGGTVTDADLPKALAVVFAREKNGFETAVADLTPNQLTVLRGLAAEAGAVRVYSSEFMDRVRISSPGAMKRALNSLVASRLIYPHHAEYRFYNPFFREWIKANL